MLFGEVFKGDACGQAPPADLFSTDKEGVICTSV